MLLLNVCDKRTIYICVLLECIVEAVCMVQFLCVSLLADLVTLPCCTDCLDVILVHDGAAVVLVYPLFHSPLHVG